MTVLQAAARRQPPQPASVATQVPQVLTYLAELPPKTVHPLVPLTVTSVSLFPVPVTLVLAGRTPSPPSPEENICLQVIPNKPTQLQEKSRSFCYTPVTPTYLSTRSVLLQPSNDKLDRPKLVTTAHLFAIPLRPNIPPNLLDAKMPSFRINLVRLPRKVVLIIGTAKSPLPAPNPVSLSLTLVSIGRTLVARPVTVLPPVIILVPIVVTRPETLVSPAPYLEAGAVVKAPTLLNIPLRAVRVVPILLTFVPSPLLRHPPLERKLNKLSPVPSKWVPELPRQLNVLQARNLFLATFVKVLPMLPTVLLNVLLPVAITVILNVVNDVRRFVPALVLPPRTVSSRLPSEVVKALRCVRRELPN